MYTFLFQLILGCIGLALLCGCTRPEDKAQQLLTEATRLVRSAQEAEKTSYSTALALYQEALNKAEMIAAKYPSSQLAETLAQDEVKIGPYALTELQDIVLPQAKLRTEAETSPLACALLVAETISISIDRAIALDDIAVEYANAGQLDRVLQIINSASDRESRSRVLSAMISKYLEPGQYEKALRITKSVEEVSLKDWALA